MSKFKNRGSKLLCFACIICILGVIFISFKNINRVEQNEIHLKYVVNYEKETTTSIDILADLSEEELRFQWCPFQNELESFENVINCEEMFESNNESSWEVAKYWKSPCIMDDHEIMNLTMNCTLLKEAFPFNWPKWEENSTKIVEFPIAYVLLAMENAEQVVRLMQAIYRPWNLYCIVYDNDTDDNFKNSIKNLHTCYDNIILPKKFVNMNLHGFSILHGIMNCMIVLHEHPIKWKYVQTLSCEDFPLKTNAETVEIMQIFNGSQDIELAQGRPDRYRIYHFDSERDEKRKDWKKPLPPHNIAIYKGSSMASTLSREFIQFVLRNKMATNFYNWCKTTWAPEEHFFPSLAQNLHIGPPGGFPGACLYYYDLERRQKLFVSRYQEWYCQGMVMSSPCAFGVGDLHKLINRQELTVHKMRLDLEPAAYYCMAKMHFMRTYNISSKLNDNPLDQQFYKNLPAVKYQNTKDKVGFEC